MTEFDVSYALGTYALTVIAACWESHRQGHGCPRLAVVPLLNLLCVYRMADSNRLLLWVFLPSSYLLCLAVLYGFAVLGWEI